MSNLYIISNASIYVASINLNDKKPSQVFLKVANIINDNLSFLPKNLTIKYGKIMIREIIVTSEKKDLVIHCNLNQCKEINDILMRTLENDLDKQYFQQQIRSFL
jgi:hypothetical protein